MATAAVEENRTGGSREGVFERRHGKLVEEAGALAAACGAGVTVIAVSPHSGEPRMSSFPGGGQAKKELVRAVRRSQEEVPGMSAAEVVAYKERLRALRLRVLQRIREEAATTGTAPKDQPSPELRRPLG